MAQLQEPGTDLASRILAKVPFKDRIIGYRMRERIGGVRVSMYAFENIVVFFDDQFPQTDLGHLQNWVENIMRDPELAGMIKNAIAEETNDHDRTGRIQILMRERLCQCKKS